jgi:hypothetical protein
MRATDAPIVIKYFFFLAIICLGIASFVVFPPYGMDDCYITYRYAYNLFHHKQFVYNLGERILGTTSPLYTLILTGVQIFSDNIPQMSNFISCISASLAGFFLFLILKKDNLPLGVFCAVCFPFILQDIGLETNFLFFLFALSAYLFARENYFRCSATLGLCFLTRQDSAVFICVILLMYWLKKRKLPWREGIVFSSCIVPWFVFSSFYFDSLFPASLQAKKGYASFTQYSIEGLWYLAQYCDRYTFYLCSFVSQKLTGFLSVADISTQESSKISLVILYLLIIILPGVIYYIKNVEKHHYTVALLYLYPLLMITALSVIAPPPGHRWHLTSAINFALIGQLHILTTPLVSRIKKPHPPFLRRTALSVCLTVLISGYLLCFIILNAKEFYTMARGADRSFWFGARFHSYKNIGCFLRDTVSDQEKVFALEVGTIGYYSKKRVIDGAGLISPGYGRYHRKGCWLMGIEKEIPNYIVAQDMVIPYFEPIFSFQNIFGKMVVFKKSKSLPEHNYPFSQLLHNWNEQKEKERNIKKKSHL